MNPKPTVIITVEKLPDFLRELNERGIKRIYRDQRTERHGSHRYNCNTYTAYDTERNVFIQADVVFPEIVALQRFELGDRYSHSWNFEHDAYCSPSSKRRFCKALKLLGVSQDIIRQYNTVKVEELLKMIDESEPEEGGADIMTRYRKGGDFSRTIEANFMDCITEIMAVVEVSSGSMNYKIKIPGWDAIYEKLCQRHEKAIAELEVVEGKIEVR